MSSFKLLLLCSFLLTAPFILGEEGAVEEEEDGPSFYETFIESIFGLLNGLDLGQESEHYPLCVDYTRQFFMDFNQLGRNKDGLKGVIGILALALSQPYEMMDSCQATFDEIIQAFHRYLMKFRDADYWSLFKAQIPSKFPKLVTHTKPLKEALGSLEFPIATTQLGYIAGILFRVSVVSDSDKIETKTVYFPKAEKPFAFETIAKLQEITENIEFGWDILFGFISHTGIVPAQKIDTCKQRMLEFDSNIHQHLGELGALNDYGLLPVIKGFLSDLAMLNTVWNNCGDLWELTGAELEAYWNAFGEEFIRMHLLDRSKILSTKTLSLRKALLEKDWEMAAWEVGDIIEGLLAPSSHFEQKSNYLIRYSF